MGPLRGTVPNELNVLLFERLWWAFSGFQLSLAWGIVSFLLFLYSETQSVCSVCSAWQDEHDYKTWLELQDFTMQWKYSDHNFKQIMLLYLNIHCNFEDFFGEKNIENMGSFFMYPCSLLPEPQRHIVRFTSLSNRMSNEEALLATLAKRRSLCSICSKCISQQVRLDQAKPSLRQVRALPDQSWWPEGSRFPLFQLALNCGVTPWWSWLTDWLTGWLAGWVIDWWIDWFFLLTNYSYMTACAEMNIEYTYIER